MSEPYVPPGDSFGASSGQSTASAGNPLPPPVTVPLSAKDERMWAMFCHLSSLSMYLGIPFGNLLGPVVIWMMQRDKSALVDDQGKEVVNFQLTMTIAFAAALVLAVTVIGLFVAVPAFAALPVVQILFTVLGAMKANEGVAYRYPLTIRFIK